MMRDLPYARRWRNMIFAPRLDIGRRLHRVEVDWNAADFHPAGYCEFVVAVEVGEVTQMPGGREVGDVRIPEQQVEWRIILAEQIIVGDIVPDQIARAQQIERRRH